MNDSNRAFLVGEIGSPFFYDHEIQGEKFYRFEVLSKRSSGTTDRVPVVISGKLLDTSNDYTGERVSISGQFRTHNEIIDGERKVKMFLFPNSIDFGNGKDANIVFFDGYICKNPIYRKTPKGRYITDLIVAVNRKYGKSDYIHCVCWGRDAAYVSRKEVGTHIQLIGRIQSREYLKKLDDGTQETRTTYEVSVNGIGVVEKEENEDERRSEENL